MPRTRRARAILYRDDGLSAIRLNTAMAECGLLRPTQEQGLAVVQYLTDTEWAAEILSQTLDNTSDPEH